MKNIERHDNSPYEFFMLVLCLYAIVALGTNVLFTLDGNTQKIIDYVDVVVCILFFGDFLYTFYRAPNRLRYLYTWGWLDLASSIPMVDFLRFGRVARVMRIFRVLRGVRATKIIAAFILHRRSEGAFLAVALVSFLLVLVSSIAILHFETGKDSNIKTAEDALWWATVTITTVGYGDKYPLTSEGRIIAAMLMTAGVGLFGTFSGFVAAWFLAPMAKQRGNEIERLNREIQTLTQTIQENLTRKIDTTGEKHG